MNASDKSSISCGVFLAAKYKLKGRAHYINSADSVIISRDIAKKSQ